MCICVSPCGEWNFSGRRPFQCGQFASHPGYGGTYKYTYKHTWMWRVGTRSVRWCLREVRKFRWCPTGRATRFGRECGPSSSSGAAANGDGRVCLKVLQTFYFITFCCNLDDYRTVRVRCGLAFCRHVRFSIRKSRWMVPGEVVGFFFLLRVVLSGIVVLRSVRSASRSIRTRLRITYVLVSLSLEQKKKKERYGWGLLLSRCRF